MAAAPLAFPYWVVVTQANGKDNKHDSRGSPLSKHRRWL